MKRTPSGYLPLICGLGGLLTINLCYLIAAVNGHVEWCIPYWDSCTSISAIGRKMPEAIVFKGLMLPVAVLVIVYWAMAYHWLCQWCNNYRQGRACMRILGMAAALFLIIYTFSLGSQGDLFRHLRYIAVNLAFTLTWLAQLLFTWLLIESVRRHDLELASWLTRSLMGLCMLILVVGISYVVSSAFYAGHRDVEDAFEWNLALLLNVHFILAFFIWSRASGTA